MGNLLSCVDINPENEETKETDAYQPCKRKLVTIQELDLNNDHKLSNAELQTWVDIQIEEMETSKKELKQEIDILKIQLNRSRKTVKEIQSELQNDEQTSIKSKELCREMSQIRIEEFVDSLLKDETVNIGWLPDVVERQLYRNVFTLLIKTLGDFVDDSQITFIGHKISFLLEAQKNK
jgi:hypothetical protein